MLLVYVWILLLFRFGDFVWISIESGFEHQNTDFFDSHSDIGWRIVLNTICSKRFGFGKIIDGEKNVDDFFGGSFLK